MKTNAKKKYSPETTTAEDLSTFIFGAVPPQNIPLEEAILGALMIDKDAIHTVLSTQVKPKTFYLDAHQLIFSAMIQLNDKSFPIDPLSVTTELKQMGRLEEIGGAYYLVELTNKVASSANIEYQCRVILQDAIRRDLGKLAAEIYRNAYDPTEDVFDTVDDAQAKIAEIAGVTSYKQEESGSDVRKQAEKDLEEKLSGKIKPLTLGIRDLDRILQGAAPGDFGVIAGRPGMGKSALLATVLMHCSNINVPTGVVTLEMSNLQQFWRLCSQICGIPVSKMKNPKKMSKDELERYRKAMREVEALPVYYFDGSPYLATIVSKCRAMVAKGAKMILIDYLQLVESGGQIREQEIAAISRRLKSLAKELGVPIIALSQLSRKVEDRGGMKRPQMSDIRESGSVEQDADWIVLIYRPEYYGITEDSRNRPLRKGLTELIVVKNRSGKVETAIAIFDGDTVSFETYDGNLEDDDDLVPMFPGSGDLFTDMEQRSGNDDDDLPF